MIPLLLAITISSSPLHLRSMLSSFFPAFFAILLEPHSHRCYNRLTPRSKLARHSMSSSSDEYVIIGFFRPTSVPCDVSATPLAFLNLHESQENTNHGAFVESVTIPTAGVYALDAVVTSVVGMGSLDTSLRSV
ncbi:hypothetical protein FRB94_006807 [Tulasnella sp. JGI-2019a]|nr:hypothetical protein FRB94_006807 [Tulasnella sp. JGI-2019a]